MVSTSAQEQTWKTFLGIRASHGGWQGGAARSLLACGSLADLRDRVTDADPNIRILAVRALAAQAVEADDDQKAAAVATILPLIHDGATNEVGYADFDCDDDEPAVRVGDVALAALEALEPNWMPPPK